MFEGAKKQGSRRAKEQRSRRAKEQKSKGAEEQKSRRAKAPKGPTDGWRPRGMPPFRDIRTVRVVRTVREVRVVRGYYPTVPQKVPSPSGRWLKQRLYIHFPLRFPTFCERIIIRLIPVYPCLSLSIPVYPCLSLSIPVYPCLSLSIPVYPCSSVLIRVHPWFLFVYSVYSVVSSVVPVPGLSRAPASPSPSAGRRRRPARRTRWR